jgi:hypothetical protein
MTLVEIWQTRLKSCKIIGEQKDIKEGPRSSLWPAEMTIASSETMQSPTGHTQQTSICGGLPLGFPSAMSERPCVGSSGCPGRATVTPNNDSRKDLETKERERFQDAM